MELIRLQLKKKEKRASKQAYVIIYAAASTQILKVIPKVVSEM